MKRSSRRPTHEFWPPRLMGRFIIHPGLQHDIYIKVACWILVKKVGNRKDNDVLNCHILFLNNVKIYDRHSISSGLLHPKLDVLVVSVTERLLIWPADYDAGPS